MPGPSPRPIVLESDQLWEDAEDVQLSGKCSNKFQATPEKGS